MAMQSFFRRSSLWPFWQADLRIKTALYYANLRRKQMGCRHGVAGAGADKFAQSYGTIVPSPGPFPRRTYAPRNSATVRRIDGRNGPGLKFQKVQPGGTVKRKNWPRP